MPAAAGKALNETDPDAYKRARHDQAVELGLRGGPATQASRLEEVGHRGVLPMPAAAGKALNETDPDAYKQARRDQAVELGGRGGSTNKTHEDGSTTRSKKSAGRTSSGVALPPKVEYAVAVHVLSPSGPGCGALFVNQFYGSNGAILRLTCSPGIVVKKGEVVVCGCAEGPLGLTNGPRKGNKLHFEVLSRHTTHESAVQAFLVERAKRVAQGVRVESPYVVKRGVRVERAAAGGGGSAAGSSAKRARE